MTGPVGQSLFLRVSQTDPDRIDALVEDIPVVTRASLAREATRIGQDALGRGRTLLLGRTLPKRGGARKRTTRR